MRSLKVKALFLLTFSAVLAISMDHAVAQEPSQKITKEDLANNNKLFIELAKKALKWEEPAEPVKIAGPIYFVGTKGLGAFLITTSEGHILMNTGMPSSGPMIVDSIRKLGFKPEDIKLMINGHAHIDRASLNTLASAGYSGARFGKKDEVNPIAHLIGTAIGWGGNPEYAAVYKGAYPNANDGKTVHRLTVKDVPVDGFWSISVYNDQGFFQKNDRNAYSLNSLTAKPNADGSYTVQFGGCANDSSNCLPIVAGWNYTVRLYRPRKEILDGTYKFPEAQKVN